MSQSPELFSGLEVWGSGILQIVVKYSLMLWHNSVQFWLMKLRLLNYRLSDKMFETYFLERPKLKVPYNSRKLFMKCVYFSWYFYWSNKKVSACPFARWLSTFSCTLRFRAIRRDFRWFGGCVAPWSSDQDAAGWTPLSWAVLHGSAEMAQVLVRTVAQVQQRRRLEWIRIIHQGPQNESRDLRFFLGWRNTEYLEDDGFFQTTTLWLQHAERWFPGYGASPELLGEITREPRWDEILGHQAWRSGEDFELGGQLSRKGRQVGHRLGSFENKKVAH